jgi:hypothetical protein
MIPRRPAKSYSDAQWDTIVHHMRGNIPGGDSQRDSDQ